MEAQIPLRLEVDLLNMGILPKTPLDQVDDPDEPKIPRQFEGYWPELDETGSPEW